MRNWLKDKKKILIVSHVSPDGDAVGSVSAFAWIAGRMGIEVVTFLEEIPEDYAPFAHPDIVEDGKADMEGVDGIVCLDCANVARLHLPFGDWEDRPDVPVLNIDHHPTNEYYGDKDIVIATSAATCQILTELANIERIALWVNEATALYMGLLTDTGGFMFNNTNQQVFVCAADLMSSGSKHNEVVESLFFSKTQGQIAFEANIMSKAVYHYKGQLVFGLIASDDFTHYGVKPSAVEESTKKLQEVKGVKVAIRLIEAAEGVRISFRSKDLNIDVSKVAMVFGGGGHKMAAGASIKNASLQVAMAQISAEFKGLLSG